MARYVTKVPATCTSMENPPDIPLTRQCVINKKLPKIETRLHMRPLIASGIISIVGTLKPALATPSIELLTASGVGTKIAPAPLNVIFQTDWEGTAGNTSIVEQSSNAATVSSAFAEGDLDSTRSKFGSTSGFSGFEDYWRAPDIAAYDLGSADFVFETWVNLRNAVNLNDEITCFSQWGAGGNAFAFNLRRDGAGNYYVRVRLGATTIDAQITNTTVTNSSTAPGTWYHMVAERIGNTVYCGFNGFVEGSGAFTGSVPTSSSQLHLLGTTAASWLGVFYLDDTRIATGGSAYNLNSGSTYTVPTAPLPLP